MIDMPQAEEAVCHWAAERRLPEAHLRRWLALAPDDRAAILRMALELRLRTGQFIAAFEMLEEIALREREAIAAVLARREIRRIFDGPGSLPGRARLLIDSLRAIRFPRLKRASDRIAGEIAALGLPPGVKVQVAKELSSDEVRVEISARSSDEMKRLIESVAERSAGLERIADLAAGIESLDDEV